MEIGVTATCIVNIASIGNFGYMQICGNIPFVVGNCSDIIFALIIDKVVGTW